MPKAKRFLVRRQLTYNLDAVVEAPNEEIAEAWAIQHTSGPINVLDPDRLFNVHLHCGPLKFEEVPEDQEVLVTIPIDEEGVVDRERLKQMLRAARPKGRTPKPCLRKSTRERDSE